MTALATSAAALTARAGGATVPLALPPELGACIVVPDFLSPVQCSQLIQAAEARGFCAAGTDYPPSYRNNDRQVVDDPELARRLLQQLRPHVPAALTADGADWMLNSLNERLRLCRYRPGQAFHIHQDGVHHRRADLRSHLTFMIYLTDGDRFEGGDTLFYDRGPGVPAPQVVGRLRPRAGTLIVFDHTLWHAGAQVTAGVKHILRSDVLYRRCGPAAAGAPHPGVPAHSGYVWALAALPDGRVASAGRDTVIRLWTRDSLPPCGSSGPLPATVHSLTAGPPAVAGRAVELRGHDRSVLGLAALGQQRLVSVSRDRSLRVWNLASGCCECSDARHDAALLAVAVVGPGERPLLAVAGADGLVHIGPPQAAAMRRQLAGHDGWVWALAALGPSGLASAGEDGSVCIWDVHRGSCGQRLPVGVPLRTLAAAPDGRELAAAGLDGRVVLWRRAGTQWRLARAWPAHEAAVRRVRYLDAGTLATAGEDGWVRIWRSRDGALLAGTRHDNFATDVLPWGARGWLSCSYDGSLRCGDREPA